MDEARDNEEEAPIELWNISGELVPVRYAPKVVDQLHVVTAMAQQLAAELEDARAAKKSIYKQVLERYNRAHGQRKKITLKQVCDDMGVSYDAVRKYRSREKKR